MVLKLFNTLGKKKEEFKPNQDNKVSIYCCGPTVYDFAHIGNFRTFLFEDIIIRYLKYKGYKIKFVMNITDVDDKTIAASIKNGKSLKEYTNKFTEEFFKDLDSLKITKATLYPKATDYIKEIEEYIKKLEK